MQSLEIAENFTTNILTEPNDILKQLHLGISIPILPEFHKYILRDLEHYSAEAIVLVKNIDEDYSEKKTDIVGITVVYGDGSDLLFFGCFGVCDHDAKKIEFLANSLLKYARKNGYKLIRGPINIPTVIFGWGFMEEKSSNELFIGCPVNNPNYQKIFIKNGFHTKFREDRYQMKVLRINPFRLKRYNFNDYIYINPGKEGMYKIKKEFIKLHLINLPLSSKITPKSSQNFDNLVNFIFEFGKEWMMFIIKHKPTNIMAGCGFVIPNPFSRDEKGRLNSASFHSWVVHPKHRRRGISMLMYGASSLYAWKDGFKWGSAPIGSDNVASDNEAKKLGGVKNRTHLILEYRLCNL